LAEAFVKASTPTTNTLTGRRADIQIPELKVITFSGKPIDYSFEVIHNHADLREDVKLRHLPNYVGEEARQAIRHLRLTTGNNDIAVKLLTDRFGRPDQIIASHLHHLERLPSIDNEDRWSSNAAY
jgi:Protein of unknown function (DUF1759)